MADGAAEASLGAPARQSLGARNLGVSPLKVLRMFRVRHQGFQTFPDGEVGLF